MSFFRSFHHRNKVEKFRDHRDSCSKTFSNVQQWSYYQDLAVQSDDCTISSELASLHFSRLQRSLYNLIYTPNDELNYFILFMESSSLSSHLKFILDVNTLDQIIREKSNEDQQTIALTIFHRYLILRDIDKPDPNCFHMSREHTWKLIEQSAYPIYLESTMPINYQPKILTSNQLQFHEVLFHQSSLSYFIKFVEEEKITDLVQFWIDTEQFYQNSISRDLDKQPLVEHALMIYDQYISLQATSRLGFDDGIRAKIECRICQPNINAAPSVDTFHQAAWIIYIILQREYFSRFLQSTTFYQYISDLVLQLHREDLISHLQRRKTFEFDTTSLDSENVRQATPLNRRRNISTSSASCLSANHKTECQPRGRFSMGYIDSLGRFIRDPNTSLSSDRKTYSKPLQFITQLVRNEQDENATEEAAARFAETFINEITNRCRNVDVE